MGPLVRAQVEEPELLLGSKRLGRWPRRFFLRRVVGIGRVSDAEFPATVGGGGGKRADVPRRPSSGGHLSLLLDITF
jgi:hypothetical protein